MSEILIRALCDAVKLAVTLFVGIPVGILAAAWIIYGIVMTLRELWRDD